MAEQKHLSKKSANNIGRPALQCFIIALTTNEEFFDKRGFLLLKVKVLDPQKDWLFVDGRKSVSRSGSRYAPQEYYVRQGLYVLSIATGYVP